MKIAVCIKQVPTREWQPRLSDDRRNIREQDASWELNEPDAYALEEALRLKETQGGEVVVCAAGPARVASVIREALAGAMREETFDLVLTGLQSDDQGHAQTGVVLATRLGLPHATIIMDVQIADGRLRVKRELEGGWFQWVAMPLPALLTIQSGNNQLRYATLKGIMAAKKKDVRKVAPASPVRPRIEVLGLHVPEKSKKTEIIPGSPADAAAVLVKKLRDDARVI